MSLTLLPKSHNLQCKVLFKQAFERMSRTAEPEKSPSIVTLLSNRQQDSSECLCLTRTLLFAWCLARRL